MLKINYGIWKENKKIKTAINLNKRNKIGKKRRIIEINFWIEITDKYFLYFGKEIKCSWDVSYSYWITHIQCSSNSFWKLFDWFIKEKFAR